MRTLIKETENYELVVEPEDNSSVAYPPNMYKIRNKKYNVVEATSTILPYAVKLIEQLELYITKDQSKMEIDELINSLRYKGE